MFSKVSVVIPAYNEERHIVKCLSALKTAERAGMSMEIIVVDNGSSDRTAALAKEHGAAVLVRPGVKIASLRNIGTAHGNGDLLAFVDADCVVKKDWLVNAVRAIERESADAVGSFHEIPDDSGWIGRTAELVQGRKTGADVRYIPSGNLIVKRSCFDAVRGFNESLETSEDVDLCHRLRLQGYRLFIDPSICSVHLGSPSGIREMFTREMWHGKSMCSVFLKDLRATGSIKAVRNLRLVLYSGLNLLLLLSVAAGAALLLWTPLPLAAALCLYLALNAIVSFRDWTKVRRGFVSLFAYSAIYGLARSLSVLGWIIRGGGQQCAK